MRCLKARTLYEVFSGVVSLLRPPPPTAPIAPCRLSNQPSRKQWPARKSVAISTVVSAYCAPVLFWIGDRPLRSSNSVGNLPHENAAVFSPQTILRRNNRSVVVLEIRVFGKLLLAISPRRQVTADTSDHRCTR
jgi:hypothetical protein